MNKDIHILLGVVLVSLIIPTGISYARERNLPGIDIISREERGADESQRIWKGGVSSIDDDEYDFQEENNGHIHDEDTTLPSPVNPYQIAEEYLKKQYPEDVAIDEIIEEQDGNAFIRPLQYRQQKKAIIIHHTASDEQKIQKSGIIQHLKNLYQFHTKTRGWGDIGYHFLIDANGNIYEGRAGGNNIIGAHTKRNNTNTIGIALIGNFQNQKPNPAQLDATIKLSAALANKYNIIPDQEVTFHERSNKAPYITQHTHPSIIGHKDAGNTSCPGTYLYNELENIRQAVTKQLLTNKISGTIAEINYMQNHHLAKQDTAKIILPYQGQEANNCDIVDDEARDILTCEKTEQGLLVHIKQNRKPTYGTKLLTVTNENDEKVLYYADIIRENDINSMLKKRSNKPKKIAEVDEKKQQQKIEHKITTNELPQLVKNDIRVLLYELSMSQTKRDIICSNTCLIQTDEQSRSGNNIIVHVYDDNNVFVGNEQTGAIVTGVDIKSSKPDGIIQVTNYQRSSYAGIPRNVFRGTLSIQKDHITDISSNEDKKQFVVINQLPLVQYLQGIAESNDQEPREKTKALAILAKQYVLYYLHPGNTHPNIDEEATYEAIDDPRSFQKYVGAGFEDTSTKRKEAVQDTQNTYVVFDNFLPILPYFSCSPGYTRTARERRGRTDTPYLQTVIDFKQGSCEEFKGHGVGLAGKGASYLANNGLKHEAILKHYYQGIKLQQIFF